MYYGKTLLTRSLGQGNIFAPVILFTGAGVPGQVPPPPPRQVHPPGRHASLGKYTTPTPCQLHPPPRSGTPPDPLGRYTPWTGTPLSGQVHPLAGTSPGNTACWEIRQQADGTHPTGMYSCFKYFNGQLVVMLFKL